jgi:prophage tail gpP-like protein
MTDSQLYLRFDGNKTGTDSEGKKRKLKGTYNLEEWSISSSYLGSTDSFSVVLYDDRPENLRDLECQPVTLYLNGHPQLIGRIDRTVRGNKGRAVECQGRDYISDLVECNIDPTFAVKEGETLGSLIVRAASPVGIKKVADGSDVATARNARTGRTVGGSAPPKSFKELKLEDFKPSPGQGIYEFLKDICQRHGCTIQTSTSRDTLLIAGPFYTQDKSYSITRHVSGSGQKNNVESSTASRDYSSFPTHVIVQGQGAPRSGEGTKSNQALIDTWAEAQHFGGELGAKLNDITWSGRRKPGGSEGELTLDKIYRLNHFRDNSARNPAQIAKAANRLLAEHLKNTLIYEVNLKGHIDPNTGAIWSVDTIVDVSDDVCDVHEPLWVLERQLSYNQSRGPTTSLKCIRPGSFEI